MNKQRILNGMSEEEFYSLYPTEAHYKMAMGGNPLDFKKEFRALVKQQMGGATKTRSTAAEDQPTYLKKRSDNFMNIIQQKAMMGMADQASQEFGDAVNQHPEMQAFAQMGMSMEDYGYNPYLNHQQEFQDSSNQIQQQGQMAMDNFMSASQDMMASQNPYTKTSIEQAQYGASMPKGPNFNNSIKSPELIEWLKNHNTGQDRSRTDQTATRNVAQTSSAQPYYSEAPVQGMAALPMNYRSKTKMSAKDVAMMQYLQANPTTNLKTFDTRHFGPWGRTKMTFGARDIIQPGQDAIYENTNPAVAKATEEAMSKDNWFDRMRTVRNAKAEDRARAKGRTAIDGTVPTDISSMYDGVNESSAYGEIFPQVYRPGMSPADMMSGNLYKQPTQQGAQDQSYDWENLMQNPINPAGPLIKQQGGAVDMYGRKIPNQQQRNTFGYTPQANGFQPNDFSKRETFGYTPPPEGQVTYGDEKDYTITQKQRPGFDKEASANMILAGINGATSLINKGQQRKFDAQMKENTLADNSFNTMPANEIGNQGDYNWTGMSDGMLRPNDYNVIQQRGYGIGYAEYGGAQNMAFGGSLNSKNTPYLNSKAVNNNQDNVSVRTTMQSVPRSEANVEVEKKEIIMTPGKGGIPNTYKAGGNRHSAGGTPLFLEPDSFVFSDTAAMRIKDPELQAQFGMTVSKSGYTPAEIAKKYKINESKKVLANKDSDKLQRDSAEQQIALYNLKLGKLSLVQEADKGFPQGIPAVAMSYIDMMKIDPSQFVQMNPGQGQDNGASDAMGQYGMMMQKGGVVGEGDPELYSKRQIKDIAKKFKLGDDGSNMYNSKEWDIIDANYKPFRESNLSMDDLESMQRTMLAQIKKLRANGLPVPDKVADTYNNIADQLTLWESGDNNEEYNNSNSNWVNGDGTQFDPTTGEKKESYINYFDPAGAGRHMDNVKQYWGKDLWKGNPNDIALPPASGYGEVPTTNAIAAKKILSKLNPKNVEASGLQGALEYAGNIGNFALTSSNKLATGRQSTTGNLYTDLAFDPATYFGVGTVKGVTKAGVNVVKQLPKKLDKLAAYSELLVRLYGPIAKEAIQKFGVDAAQWLGKNATKLAQNETLQSALISGVTRLSSGYNESKKQDSRYKKLEFDKGYLEQENKKLKKELLTKTPVAPVTQTPKKLVAEVVEEEPDFSKMTDAELDKYLETHKQK